MVSLGGVGSFMLSSLSSVTLQEEGLVFHGWTQPGGHILGGGQVTQRNRSSLLVHMASPFLPPPPKGAPAAPPPRSLPGAQSVRCCFQGLFSRVGGDRHTDPRGGASLGEPSTMQFQSLGPENFQCSSSPSQRPYGPEDTALDPGRPAAESDPRASEQRGT